MRLPVVGALVLDLLEAGGVPVGEWRGGLLVGTTETGELLVSDDGATVSTHVSRGDLARVSLRTADPAVLDHYLAVTFGNDWRAKHGLPSLRRTVGPESPDVRAVGAGDDGWTVVRGESTVAGDLARSDARALARALAHPLVEVVASFRDPEGRPVFPQSERPR